MDFTETEVVEVPLWYGKCTYRERNDINTEHVFKNIEKRKEKKKIKIYI